VKLPIAPDAWHHLVLELRGKELKVTLDGQPALTYVTLCGDVPKRDLGLQPGGKSPRPLATWFDDVRIEPLTH
jgi:hypothetical protein